MATVTPRLFHGSPPVATLATYCSNRGKCLSNDQKYLVLFLLTTCGLRLARFSWKSSSVTAGTFTFSCYLINCISRLSSPLSVGLPLPPEEPPPLQRVDYIARIIARLFIYPSKGLWIGAQIIAKNAPDLSGQVYCIARNRLVAPLFKAIKEFAIKFFKVFIVPPIKWLGELADVCVILADVYVITPLASLGELGAGAIFTVGKLVIKPLYSVCRTIYSLSKTIFQTCISSTIKGLGKLADVCVILADVYVITPLASLGELGAGAIFTVGELVIKPLYSVCRTIYRLSKTIFQTCISSTIKGLGKLIDVFAYRTAADVCVIFADVYVITPLASLGELGAGAIFTVGKLVIKPLYSVCRTIYRLSKTIFQTCISSTIKGLGKLADVCVILADVYVITPLASLGELGAGAIFTVGKLVIKPLYSVRNTIYKLSMTIFAACSAVWAEFQEPISAPPTGSERGQGGRRNQGGEAAGSSSQYQGGEAAGRPLQHQGGGAADRQLQHRTGKERAS